MKKDLINYALIQKHAAFSLLLAALRLFLRITPASEFRTFLIFCIASVLFLLTHMSLVVFIPSILIHSRQRVDINARPPQQISLIACARLHKLLSQVASSDRLSSAHSLYLRLSYICVATYYQNHGAAHQRDMYMRMFERKIWRGIRSKNRLYLMTFPF